MEIDLIVLLGVGFFSFIPFVITVWNFKYLKKPRLIFNDVHSVERELSVTVLIPARNEEENIGQVLSSLRKQTYVNYEVIVLNDRSEDGTAAIVSQFLDTDLSIQLIEGLPTPSGWLGKHWACHQLSSKAKGDFWLFMDADTVLAQDTIRSAIDEAILEKSDLLTVIPSRSANNFIERALYGFIDWAIFAWIPLQIAHWSKNSYLSASYGQFMLFRKKSYLAVGGHEKIKDVAVDDFELGRSIKKGGFNWTLKDGTHMVKALPYSGLLESIKGVSRSLAPALDYRFSLVTLLSMGLMTLFFLPVCYLYLGMMEKDYLGDTFVLSLFAMVLLIGSYFVSCKKFSHSSLLIPFIHPTIIIMILIAFHSILANIFRFATWKNRNMIKTRVKF